ncbi:MAG: hypothetical protein LBI79_03710 [Nitrososphaerota archaeon]|jgi:hypothetical protein|nr:hypothetical protein [Nitrososphaerota archaeon]
MTEKQEQKKKRMKQYVVLEQDQAEAVQNAIAVAQILEKLAKTKQYVDIQVCLNCKSPLIGRVGSMAGDLFSWMSFTPPKYECEKCGWTGSLVLKATNKPTTIRDVAIMAEAKNLETTENSQTTKPKTTTKEEH